LGPVTAYQAQGVYRELNHGFKTPGLTDRICKRPITIEAELATPATKTSAIAIRPFYFTAHTHSENHAPESGESDDTSDFFQITRETPWQ
jgi:hypothetical protein